MQKVLQKSFALSNKFFSSVTNLNIKKMKMFV